MKSNAYWYVREFEGEVRDENNDSFDEDDYSFSYLSRIKYPTEEAAIAYHGKHGRHDNLGSMIASRKKVSSRETKFYDGNGDLIATVEMLSNQELVIDHLHMTYANTVEFGEPYALKLLGAVLGCPARFSAIEKAIGKLKQTSILLEVALRLMGCELSSKTGEIYELYG